MKMKAIPLADYIQILGRPTEYTLDFISWELDDCIKMDAFVKNEQVRVWSIDWYHMNADITFAQALEKMSKRDKEKVIYGLDILG